MNSLKRFVLCAFAALGLLLPPAAPSHAAPESTMDAIVKRGTLRVGFSSFVPWACRTGTASISALKSTWPSVWRMIWG